jgi:tRNA nucleotidyltransferase/poly(A) polymerase
MKVEKPSLFFNSLYHMGILKDIFPSLNNTWGRDHGQYHDENVFEHGMIAGGYAGKHWPLHCKRNPLFRLTAYLHDVGKSEPNVKDGAIHFYDHEQKGYDMLRDELKALKFSTDEIKYVTHLVLVHMRGGIKMTPKTTRKLIKRFFELDVNWKEWMGLKVIDRVANTQRENFTKGKIESLINKFKHELDPKPRANGAVNAYDHKGLAISGTHIQRLLHIGPSQIIGVILDHLLQRVMAEPSLNTLEQLEKIIVGKRNLKKAKQNDDDRVGTLFNVHNDFKG